MERKTSNTKNITIKDLLNEEIIDYRVFYALKDNGLENLKDILEYFDYNGTFRKLRNIDFKSDKKLSSFCNDYILKSRPVFNEEIKEKSVLIPGSILNVLELSDITGYDELSVRAKNQLKRASISNAKELLEYFLKKQDFLKIRNIGKNTNVELINFTNKFISDIDKYRVENENYVTYEFKADNSEEAENFENQYYSHLNLTDVKEYDSLSVRVKNCLIDNEIVTINDLLKYYSKNNNFNKLRNIGNKTNEELVLFTEFIFKSLRGNTLEYEKNFITQDPRLYELILYLKKHFEVVNETHKNEIERMFNEKSIHFFKLVNILALCFFKKQHFIVFDHYYKYREDNQLLTLSEIGDEAELTRERVRQLILTKISNFFKKIKLLIKTFPVLIDFSIKYFDQSDDIIAINEVICVKIKKQESTYNNLLFISKIFGILYKENYELYSFSFNKNPKHYYLIKSSLYNSFKVEEAFAKLLDIIQERKYRDINIDLESFVYEYIKFKDIELLGRCLNITEKILNTEFDIYLNENRNIELKRTKKKGPIDHIQEVFSENVDAIISTEEIFKNLNCKYPALYNNLNEIKPYIMKVPGVICIGRTGTYLFTDNISDESNTKGGTLGDMVVEFLKEKKEPAHIYEIVKFLGKFYKTNSKNLLTNLRYRTKDDLIFFKYSFIGLKGINYNEEMLNFNFIPRGLYTTMLSNIGYFKYEELDNKKKKEVDKLIKNGTYFINKHNVVTLNIPFKQFVERVALKYNIKQIQVLFELEPRIETGDLYLDEMLRINYNRKEK